MIIHFHGFASAGKGSKYEMLQECYPNQNIWSPNLPVKPELIEKLIGGEIEDHFESLNSDFGMRFCFTDEEPLTEKERVQYQSQQVSLVGTSMGGFYALYFSIAFGVPALLVNPVTNPSIHMRKYIGTQKNLKTGKSFEWKQKYLDTLEKMEQTILEATMVKERIVVVLGEKDKSVDPKQAKRFFPDQVRIKVYPDDHRFLTWFPKVLMEKEVQDLLTCK